MSGMQFAVIKVKCRCATLKNYGENGGNEATYTADTLALKGNIIMTLQGATWFA